MVRVPVEAVAGEAFDRRNDGKVHYDRVVVTVDAAGVGRLSRSESKTNMMTGETTSSLTSSELPGLPQGVAVRNDIYAHIAGIDIVRASLPGGEAFRERFGEYLPPIVREDVKGFLKRRPVWLTQTMTLDQMLQMAAVMELQAAQFYEKSAGRCTDLGVRELLIRLAEAFNVDPRGFAREEEARLLW